MIFYHERTRRREFIAGCTSVYQLPWTQDARTPGESLSIHHLRPEAELRPGVWASAPPGSGRAAGPKVGAHPRAHAPRPAGYSRRSRSRHGALTWTQTLPRTVYPASFPGTAFALKMLRLPVDGTLRTGGRTLGWGGGGPCLCLRAEGQDGEPPKISVAPSPKYLMALELTLTDTGHLGVHPPSAQEGQGPWQRDETQGCLSNTFPWKTQRTPLL